jgi:DNA-binding NarL/FixJ family response regulator
MIRSFLFVAGGAAAALARRRMTGGSALDRLTARQRQVLGALARGRQTKEIARELGIAESTVKTHLAKAIHRLGATTRAQAVARYIELTKP